MKEDLVIFFHYPQEIQEKEEISTVNLILHKDNYCRSWYYADHVEPLNYGVIRQFMHKF